MINADKPQKRNEDTRSSVLQYNEWFMNFAPITYQSARHESTLLVEHLFSTSNFVRNLSTELLARTPHALTTLRMLCAPPIARDRLAGLADVSRSQVKAMEEGNLPSRNRQTFVDTQIPKLLSIIERLLDRELLPWLNTALEPKKEDLDIAKAVVSDRLCGVTSDPIIRNAQEKRQLDVIENYLKPKGYSLLQDSAVSAFEMPRGTYAFHKNVRMYKNADNDSDGYVNTPIDVVIMPLDETINAPYLIECKSAGDFANTNKRRKEEDTKVTQLRGTYGEDITLYLFLCGYFDATYLGYEAANHMDWIWEHRIEDLELLGI